MGFPHPAKNLRNVHGLMSELVQRCGCKSFYQTLSRSMVAFLTVKPPDSTIFAQPADFLAMLGMRGYSMSASSLD